MEKQVNILRRGFNSYVPAEQICNFLNIEYKGKLSSGKDFNLKIIEVIQKDDSVRDMVCINVDSLKKYIEDLQNEFEVDKDRLIKLLFGMYNFHLEYQSQLKDIIEEVDGLIL
jgi:hypothetical protein